MSLALDSSQPAPQRALAGLARGQARVEFEVIASLARKGARVLDVGCGDGALLQLLQRAKGVTGRGLEISQAGVNACVAKGLSVIQGDADRALAHFPDGAFDLVILSDTIQQVRYPRRVLEELARIADRTIVSFPNFGHIGVRWRLFTRGRMPNTRCLPARWCDTENLHLCTVRDFAELVEEMGLRIETAVPISGGRPGAPFAKNLWRANWFAEEAVFLLAKP
ncbi:MAG: methionine biosynthesis protein MetW [Alphaproteobacteria bacterium]|nr:methionine biosynthesis protein MetW [Alphaproteobacteria bacterium]